VSRRLFNLAAVVSLTLCIIVCALWVRSYWATEQINRRNASGARSVCSARVQITVDLLLADWSRDPGEWHGPRYQRQPPPFDAIEVEVFSPPPGATGNHSTNLPACHRGACT
jgi:hypothetical protein